MDITAIGAFSVNSRHGSGGTSQHPAQRRNIGTTFILLSCLFPLWGCAASLNDILITQFKSVFALSDFASALVQSAFYSGYFLIAIPASLVIRSSNKLAIILGFALYIIDCALFYPAARMATYTMFLAAIFAISIGLSFLETAANTYSAMIGHRDYVTLRLNISQMFYPASGRSWASCWGNTWYLMRATVSKTAWRQ